MSKLSAMGKAHRSADEKAKDNGTPVDEKWQSKEAVRNSIPVRINHVQDLDVLHVEAFDAKDGMGECISFLFKSKDNGAVFNVRWYWMTKERENAPSKRNEVTKNLLLQVKEQYGLYEDEILSLKGKTIRARVEKVVGFGKDHYAISNLAQPLGESKRAPISA